MTDQKKRIYDCSTRHAQAALTRSRILQSAKQLFHTEGFEAVTIEQIAQAAEVSAPTIYSLFQSKRGVLHAIMNEALPSDKHEALVKGAMQAKSAKELFKIAAKFARQMYDAERAQMGLFSGAAVLAPEFKDFERKREQSRYERQEETFKMAVQEDSLAPGLSLSQARDIVWALTGRDIYRMLVVEQGWTSDAYEHWLAQLLISTLLKPNSRN